MLFAVIIQHIQQRHTEADAASGKYPPPATDAEVNTVVVLL